MIQKKSIKPRVVQQHLTGGKCYKLTQRQDLWLENCLNHKIWCPVCFWMRRVSISNKLTNQMEQFYKFITWPFVSLSMFRVPPRPSSGAYNCINSLWFYLGAWWYQCC
jgi:hypothetical protein